MNKEELKRRIEVMQAFYDGEEIEIKNIIINDFDNKWEDVYDPAFYWSDYDYRIKPKQEYVPFTFEDREIFIDRWVRVKGNLKTEAKILYISVNGIGIGKGTFRTYEECFEEIEFTDGTPFGKLK